MDRHPSYEAMNLNLYMKHMCRVTGLVGNLYIYGTQERVNLLVNQ